MQLICKFYKEFRVSINKFINSQNVITDLATIQ